jgi:energy-coupling factor transporter transmembrane protein EcfT
LHLHPSTRILICIITAVTLQWLQPPAMAGFSVLLVLALAAAGAWRQFAILLRRARWLLISLLTIYVLATPGDNLLPVLGAFGPTRQGLEVGGLQAWRLAALLAALALLLATAPRDQLLAGLYGLLKPLQLFGVDAERIAVRLWLTLHYSEQGVKLKGADWRLAVRAALAPEEGGATESVCMEMAPLRWLDAVAMMTMVTLSTMMLL